MKTNIGLTVLGMLFFLMWLASLIQHLDGSWKHAFLVTAFVALVVLIIRIKFKSKNIEPEKSDGPKWDPADSDASLLALFQYVMGQAAASISWYWDRKKSKALLSQVIRFTAWGLAAVAGVLPILGNLTGVEKLKDGLLASLLVGTAAALLGLDKVFGFSTGWARYVLAATNIKSSMEQFRLEWAQLIAKAGPKPTYEAAQPLLERAAKFRLEAENFVVQETKDWITEFQSTMAQLEKDVAIQVETLKQQVDKATQAASQTGAIKLTIQNHGNAAPGSVNVTLTGSKGNPIQAKNVDPTWTRINIAPGQYELRIDANVGGNPVSPSTIVTVEAGKVAAETISL
jgi:hypothetical protein